MRPSSRFWSPVGPLVQLPVCLVCLVCIVELSGQSPSVAAIYPDMDGITSHLLFEFDGGGFSRTAAFTSRTADLASNQPQLAVSGDFTGDGHTDLALFEALGYVPNLNPQFNRSVVEVYRMSGEQMVPSGTWYAAGDTTLNLSYLDFSVAGDYNQDGFDDIALFYNDPGSDQLDIFLLESDGTSFSEMSSWYSCDRNEFNFTAVKFACRGDFNGNGLPDIAVYYNYFGTDPGTKQSIFLFESDGGSFSLLPSAYDGTKAAYDFSDFRFALPGTFGQDAYTDLVVISVDPASSGTEFILFAGSGTGHFTSSVYLDIPSAEMDPDGMVHAVAGGFSGGGNSDLALFFSDPDGGNQEILLLEVDGPAFRAPYSVFSTDSADLDFKRITAALAGDFVRPDLVIPAQWKHNRKGALSFTFDDGYRGAFEYGADELEVRGMKGTFYIFTDTTLAYDGEIAGTSLVRTCKDQGHEIGSHTVNHSDLGQLTGAGDLDSLSRVLAGSVEVLNERFHQQTLTMSIPYGSFRPATLDSISNHFLSARSSQYGFNLATPYDFSALKSWPVLSTTTPAFVDTLIGIAETHGHYLCLMYHDISDVSFDEDSLIYTYLRADFRETVEMAADREVWIDTHQNVYKYIRERNAFYVSQVETAEAGAGHFSFVAEDGLDDSLYNVELTLLIRLPGSWTGDTVTVETGERQLYTEVLADKAGTYIYFNCLPSPECIIHVYDGKKPGTGVREKPAPLNRVSLFAFPNPFQAETIVKVNGDPVASRNLIISDIQGRIIRTIPMGKDEEIRLSRKGLSPGIYLLQLMEDGIPVATLRLVAR